MTAKSIVSLLDGATVTTTVTTVDIDATVFGSAELLLVNGSGDGTVNYEVLEVEPVSGTLTTYAPVADANLTPNNSVRAVISSLTGTKYQLRMNVSSGTSNTVTATWIATTLA